MATVEKIDGEYFISVAEGSIKGGYKPHLTDVVDPLGETPTHSFNAQVTVVITEDMAGYARALCSANLDLGVDLGSPTNTLAILKGMMSAPIPIAPSYGSGNIPELDEADISDISTNLEAVNREFEVTFNANISNGAYMALVFMPDARGFNIELVDMSAGLALEREHSFALTSAFIIDTLPESECSAGPGSESTPASLDDAKIFSLTKTVSVSFAETLTTEIVRSRASAERGHLIDAYYLLLNEMFWRDGAITAGRHSARPYVDHMYGVGVSGRALQIIPLTGLVGSSARPGVNLNLRGTAEVQFIYGDIRFPANPLLSAAKPTFDIISDSEEWTKYGPTTEKYIGGDTAGPEPTTIFSWEGRTSASPKTLPQIAAQLEDF